MSWSVVDHDSPRPELPENLDDILVFGYGCKLFRDDEKAEWIDKEKHLIPWMGDVELTMDRYDGRGALMDLKPFVAPPEGTVSEEFIAPEDEELEKLLEEERYKDLREDSEYDDLDYQEVEFRKFQSDVNGVVGQGQYAAIGYSYDEASSGTTAVYPKPKAIDEDLPYVNPVGLIIPEDIILPTTIKLHAIIEKTAKFIASNGNQMEIILKTKQSGNPLFNFLGYTDSLNPYYKFLVQEIRSNNYKPAEEAPEADLEPSQEECSGSEDESSYLHPSLFRSSTAETVPPVSKITYKHPSGPTAYSMLVSKIKGSNPDPVPPTTNTTDTYNYYYSQGQVPSTAYPQEWSDSTSEQSSSISLDPSEPPTRPQSQVPAQQDQLVIEKMASYVVKNGYAFEELARTKGDPRFVFLHPTHEYHWYYLNCKERFKAETSSVVASGNFVSYSDSASTNNTSSSSVATTVSSIGTQLSKTIKNLEIRRINPQQKVPITLQSISLPLSASGIPIANHASISSRPATIPPEVASRIEEIKKKNNLFGKKDQPLSLEVKKEKVKIQFSSSICKNMSLGTEIISVSDEEKIKSEETVMPNKCESDRTEILSNQQIDSSIKVEDTTDVDVEILVNLGNGSQSQLVVEGDMEDAEEKDRKRKVERRRKAALFLQKIKLRSQNPDTNASKTPTEALLSTNNNESEKNGVDEDVSEVESIPDLAAQEVHEDLKENDIRSSDKSKERLREESKIQVGEINRINKNGSASRTTSRHVRRSRSRSRGHSVSSRRRSLSTSSKSSVDSSKSKRKHSKWKHSKKRKKKHEKDRSSSRSRSKKSKRHKH